MSDFSDYDMNEGYEQNDYELGTEQIKNSRKMDDSSDDEIADGAKKQRTELNGKDLGNEMDTGKGNASNGNDSGNGQGNDSGKGNGKKTKDKKKKNDDWIQNKIYRTFFMEPELDPKQNKADDNNKHFVHVMEVARILRNLKINYTELKQAGKFRYKITFAHPRHAEQLINCKILKEQFKYRVYVPNMFKETIGVIKSIPPTIPDEEIKTNLESGNIKITKVERIMKLDKNQTSSSRTTGPKLIPTYSVKIYAEGDKLPKEVRVYGIPSKVNVYLFPLNFCWKCLRYGHKQKACKSQQTNCAKCSQNGHERVNCTSEEVKCFHCAEPHTAFDANCVERIRQDNIRKAMAYNKLTFLEAEKLYPRTDKLDSTIQARIQSTQEFPQITGTQTLTVNPTKSKIPTISHKLQSINHNNTTQIKEHQSEQYITKTEFEKILSKIKIDIIKQLNLTKLITKIKQIQDKIAESLADTGNPTRAIDNNLLLIDIGEQLRQITEPETNNGSSNG